MSYLIIIPARKNEVHLKLARTVDGPEWITDGFISISYKKLSQFFSDLSEPIMLAGVLEGLDSFSGKHLFFSVSVLGEVVSSFAFQFLKSGQKGDFLKVVPKYSHHAI